MSKSAVSSSVKSSAGREVDKQLWRTIQEKAGGKENERIEAVRLLFDRHGDLPEESTTLLQKLASKDQPASVRMAIANQLRESSNFSDFTYLGILGVLSNDPDPHIKSITKEIYEKLMEPITALSESLEAAIQPVTIPQIDLSALKHIQESLTAAASLWATIQPITIPAIDTSTLRYLHESLAGVANLSARAIIDPMIVSKQAIDSIARSAQAALPSYYPQLELEAIDRIPQKLKEGRASRLRSKLRNCAPGKAHWKAYQDACREILSYTLVPPLLEPSEESATRDRAHRRDLIFHIPYAGAGNFWEGIKLTYKSLALIVECKNHVGLLHPNQVTITSKYFGEKRLGLLGAIVSRHGFSESARREQTRLWLEDGKMILSLTDNDMANMLTLKEAHDDPSKVIDNAIRLFRQSI